MPGSKKAVFLTDRVARVTMVLVLYSVTTLPQMNRALVVRGACTDFWAADMEAKAAKLPL